MKLKGIFKYWHRKYWEESKVVKSKKTRVAEFIMISIPVVDVLSSCELELVYPNGVRLYFNFKICTSPNAYIGGILT